MKNHSAPKIFTLCFITLAALTINSLFKGSTASSNSDFTSLLKTELNGAILIADNNDKRASDQVVGSTGA